jgi:hypothetical protein
VPASQGPLRKGRRRSCACRGAVSLERSSTARWISLQAPAH